MNINYWLSENKPLAALLAITVIGSGVLGYLVYSAWDDYGSATAIYSSKASDLDRLSHNPIFPSSSNLKKINQTLMEDRSNLDKLRTACAAYIIPPIGGIEKVKPQDQPQYFQDTLRKLVTDIKALAASMNSTFPPSFYLGMDEYENQLPAPEQLSILPKQLTVLHWIAKVIANQKGVVVAEFSRLQPDANKNSSAQKSPNTPAGSDKTGPAAPYEALGGARITLNCSQASLHELINTLSSAPYFLVIEDLKIQNSVTEPPRRDAALQPTDQPSDGSGTIQRLPIVVGRESVNVIIKIRFIDFPSVKNQQEAAR
jgi:hypothetical protein